jgi:hypothetical protein
MGKPKPPEPTDPRITAAAQTNTSIDTANANSFLNNVNQITPYGSLIYKNTPQWITDSEGHKRLINRWTATQSLSGAQQRLLNTTQGAAQNYANLLASQSGKLGDILGKPFKLGNEEVEARLMELGRKRLDPALGRIRETEDTRLANSGIQVGSEAYKNAMANRSYAENDAYNSLLLQGRQLADQELTAEHTMPLNDMMALLSGSQVQQPNFISPNNYNIPTTDRAGIQANYDNQRFNNWNAENQNRMGLFSTFFKLGSGLISDERLKIEKRPIGTTFDGQTIWSFRYIFGGPVHIGLMAQEVEKTRPEAVIEHPAGFKLVDYGLALQGA